MESTPYDPKKVGKRIRKRLKEIRMKQGDFAKRVGRHRIRVSHWLNGEGLPDIQTMIEIARVLGMSLEELTGQSGIQGRTDIERRAIADFERLIGMNDEEVLEDLSRHLQLLVELVRARKERS